jgi:hypothetical protein
MIMPIIHGFFIIPRSNRYVTGSLLIQNNDFRIIIGVRKALLSSRREGISFAGALAAYTIP